MTSIRGRAVILAIKKAGLLNQVIDSKNLSTLRLQLIRLEKYFPVPRWAKIEPVKAQGFKGEWIKAPRVAEDRVVLYIHGGGFVFNTSKLYRNMISYIARYSKAKVLSIDYSLAPEFPFPVCTERGFGSL